MLQSTKNYIPQSEQLCFICITGDLYSAYNKPVAVIDWLAKNKVEEDFILVLDADMIMREPFMPDELGVRPGRAVSAFYGYLKGVNNKLALKHVPEVLPRNDTDAGKCFCC